jgi:glycosyltransferase involved in cell wall biosynthesis
VRLSVVIPAHNAERYLDSALDSALRELPPDAELIVVDDGSTDTTPQILQRRTEHLLVLRNQVALGPGEARNRGVRASSAPLVAFHDADDLVLPGRFARLLEVLEARPEVDLAFGNGIKIDGGNRPIGPLIPVRYSRRLRRHVGVRELLEGGLLYPQALCIRRRAFDALDGFVAERAEDWDFALRAALLLRLEFLDVPLFAYRKHAESMSMQERQFSHVMLTMLERFLEAHPEARRVAGDRAVRAALAKRHARCARHDERAGDFRAAAEGLARAVALSPTSLRYRWRLLTLPRCSRGEETRAP